MAEDLKLPEQDYLQKIINRALSEDLAYGADITTQALVSGSRPRRVRLYSRQSGRACGIPIARQILDTVLGKGEYRVHLRVADGTNIAADVPLLEVTGEARGLLQAQQTIINFLGHLSGIATYTARWADALARYVTVVRDTRRTTPGLRELEKYAVRAGGGINSRLGLGSLPVLTRQHFELATGVADAILAVKSAFPDKPIEAAAHTLMELDNLLQLQVPMIMLEDMSPELVSQAVAHRDALNTGTLLEVTGDVSLEQAQAYGCTKVDYIAVPDLISGAPSLPIVMEFVG